MITGADRYYNLMPAKSPEVQFVTTFSRSEEAALPGEPRARVAHFVSFAGWPGEEAVCATNDIPYRVNPKLIFHQLALPPELGKRFLLLVGKQKIIERRNDGLEMLSTVWGSCEPNLDMATAPNLLESGQPYVLTDVNGRPLLGVVGTNVEDQSLSMFNIRGKEYPTSIIITQTDRFMKSVGASAIFPLLPSPANP